LLHATNGVDQEKAAHRFAAAFLAPRAAVYRELGRTRGTLGLEELRLLKQEYGLSMQAWIYRAYALNVISNATFERLFRVLSARGMRKDEGTPAREPDRARRFELLVRQAEVERFLTPARAAELLGAVPRSARPRYTLAQLQAAAAEAGDPYAAGEVDEWTQISGETLADEEG
jgi:Zn-dependent peptidase ImmA (M78 family)